MSRNRVSRLDKWCGFSEGKIKRGVHTHGLTHCLHIVFGVHTTKLSVHSKFHFYHILWGFAVCTSP